MAEFRLSPAAQADLDGIFDYSARQWGVAQAVQYVDDLQRVCAELAETPTQAFDFGHIRPGYRRGMAGSHSIYFRIEDYGIAVIRILHQRMDASRHF